MLHVAGTNQKSRVVLSKEHMVFEPIGGYWMNHDESDALCELDILFFSPSIFHFLSFVSTCADGGILRTQRVVDRAMQLHGGLGGQPEQNSRAWGWLYHVFIYFFYSWRFCHVLLIFDVVFSVRRLKLMFKPQIIRRVAIQSGLQYFSVIHIAYQESDIHAGSQDSFLPAAFVGRRPQESKYFELGSGLLLVTACGMMTKSALLLASNWKLS